MVGKISGCLNYVMSSRCQFRLRRIRDTCTPCNVEHLCRFSITRVQPASNFVSLLPLYPHVMLVLFTLLYTLPLFWSFHTILGNTEIVNFVAVEENSVEIPITDPWPRLNELQNEARWELMPAPLHTAIQQVCEPLFLNDHHCPHELWVTLDMDHTTWGRFSRFTLRLSWPASYPAAFLVEVLDGKALQSQLGKTTPLGAVSSSRRVKYARIRVVDTGIATPSIGSTQLPEPVPFNLILEPLYFGLIPQSVLPVILFLVVVVVLASMTVPFINSYVNDIAQSARLEKGRNMKRE